MRVGVRRHRPGVVVGDLRRVARARRRRSGARRSPSSSSPVTVTDVSPGATPVTTPAPSTVAMAGIGAGEGVAARRVPSVGRGGDRDRLLPTTTACGPVVDDRRARGDAVGPRRSRAARSRAAEARATRRRRTGRRVTFGGRSWRCSLLDPLQDGLVLGRSGGVDRSAAVPLPLIFDEQPARRPAPRCRRTRARSA